MDLIYRINASMLLMGIAIKGYRLTLIKDLFGKELKKRLPKPSKEK